MTTPFSCPKCGARLELYDDAETETATWHANPSGMPWVETKLRHANIASCPACEFCIEVKG